MINVNDYIAGCDSETIERAIAAKGQDGIILLPPRKSDKEPERDYWLLDRAILLPENTTVILQNCKLKLSDRCRDNFFPFCKLWNGDRISVTYAEHSYPGRRLLCVRRRGSSSRHR